MPHDTPWPWEMGGEFSRTVKLQVKKGANAALATHLFTQCSTTTLRKVARYTFGEVAQLWLLQTRLNSMQHRARILGDSYTGQMNIPVR